MFSEIALVFFWLWMIYRWVVRQKQTGQEVSLWAFCVALLFYFQKPGVALILAYALGCSLFITLDGFLDVSIFIILTILFLFKVEGPFSSILKPSNHFAFLSLMFILSMALTYPTRYLEVMANQQDQNL